MTVDSIVENMLKDAPPAPKGGEGGDPSDVITRDEFESALNVNFQKVQKEIQDGLKSNLDTLMKKIDESAGKTETNNNNNDEKGENDNE